MMTCAAPFVLFVSFCTVSHSLALSGVACFCPSPRLGQVLIG